MTNIALTTANRVEVVQSLQQHTLPAAEAIVAGAPVRMDTTSGKWTNANGTTAAEARVYGIATRTVAIGESLTALRRGIMDGFAITGLDYDAPLYLSDTDGRVNDGAGTVNLVLGRVIAHDVNTLGTAFDKRFLVEIENAEDIALDNLTVAGTLEVTGASTFNGAVALGNNAGVDTVTVTADTTVATGGTVAVADADALTVGGVIVPQSFAVSIPVIPHASLTEMNLFTAREALQVLSIDVVPDLVQGGALTGTVVKAVGTATPVKTTTPMHAADAIDFNAAAHTVQPMTLSVTTADLQLAAGNRIALDLSGALDTGRATVTIRLKRI